MPVHLQVQDLLSTSPCLVQYGRFVTIQLQIVGKCVHGNESPVSECETMSYLQLCYVVCADNSLIRFG